MLIGFSTGASAVTTGTVCPDCYKCVKYSGINCLQCEYDPDYCMGEVVCEDGQYHNGMVGILAQCLDCPTLNGCLRGPHSTEGAGITGCYYGVDAICADSAGSYVFSEDCRYDDSDSSEEEVEEEIEIN